MTWDVIHLMIAVWDKNPGCFSDSSAVLLCWAGSSAVVVFGATEGVLSTIRSSTSVGCTVSTVACLADYYRLPDRPLVLLRGFGAEVTAGAKGLPELQGLPGLQFCNNIGMVYCSCALHLSGLCGGRNGKLDYRSCTFGLRRDKSSPTLIASIPFVGEFVPMKQRTQAILISSSLSAFSLVYSASEFTFIITNLL
ncbi:hypothetical protein J6590_070640 [Homalodisca vitripennis]|nr:hypothetical protein J6590_070640 [Homalodisca vitripennis]